MPGPVELITVAVLGILGVFLWRYLKAGSVVGALLGGRIRETVGETTLESSAVSSTVLRVQVLDVSTQAEPVIALSITRKAILGASVMPLRLTRAQAREVGEMLGRAARSF